MTRTVLTVAALLVASPALAGSLYGTSGTASYDADNAAVQETMETETMDKAMAPATVRTTTVVTPNSVDRSTTITTDSYDRNYDSDGNPTWYGDYTFKLD